MPSTKRIAIAVVWIVVVMLMAFLIFNITQLGKHEIADPIPLYDCNLQVLNPQVTEVSGYNDFYVIFLEV
jgi:hypothetical protein